MAAPAFISVWKDLCSFRPPVALQDDLFKRFDVVYWALRKTDPDADPTWGYYHAIEDAAGDNLNLDRYQIWVERLPNHPVTKAAFTPESLLTYFRTNINSFLDTSVSAFYPYAPHREPPGTVDETKWLSSSPLGAVMTIEIDITGGTEFASVVCTLIEPRRWIFSTMKTPGDFNHPVSGNREFGFYRGRYKGKDGWAFQTRGADRVTPSLIPEGPTFEGADRLWRSLQAKFKEFVDREGGVAEIIDPFSQRFPWDDVSAALFSPSIKRLHIPQSELTP
jgi:hypothetical protein